MGSWPKIRNRLDTPRRGIADEPEPAQTLWSRVAINSVVFRSLGQNLTIAGTYIEMASRLLEPTLVAFGALAVRGRIKR